MNAVEAILGQVARDVGALSATAVDVLRPVLARAERELARDLKAWLATVPDGAQRFTAQMYRNALVQMRGALGAVRGMAPGIESGLTHKAGVAGAMALGHLEAELQSFASYFADSIRPIPLGQAAILAEGREMLTPRFRSSGARYAGQVGTDIRAQLATGVVRGETLDQLTKRLIKLGGPKGLVALRGVAGEPGAYAEFISEGLFKRYGHWAERLARTETLQAYNVHADMGLREWARDDDEALSRWDAANDLRVCLLCRRLHDETVKVGGAFPGGYRHPPAHPQCRCALTAWNHRWGRPSETLTAPIPTTPLPKIEAPPRGPRAKKFAPQVPPSPPLPPVPPPKPVVQAPPPPTKPVAPPPPPKPRPVPVVPAISSPSVAAPPSALKDIVVAMDELDRLTTVGGQPSTRHLERAIRESIDTILSKYGVFNRDIRLARVYEVQHGLAAKEGARGLHYPSGRITIDGDVHKDALEFFRSAARGRPDPQKAQGARTVIHEALHGHGGLTGYGGPATVVEEVTTEVTARRVLRESFGLPYHANTGSSGSYQYFIDDVAKAVKDVSGSSMDAAFDALDDACLKFKKLPASAEIDELTLRTGSNTTPPKEVVDRFVEQFDLSPSQRAELARRIGSMK